MYVCMYVCMYGCIPSHQYMLPGRDEEERSAGMEAHRLDLTRGLRERNLGLGFGDLFSTRT